MKLKRKKLQARLAFHRKWMKGNRDARLKREKRALERSNGNLSQSNINI